VLWLRVAGWNTKGAPSSENKFVMIAYPHTSNWDVPLTIAICMVYRLKIYWMGKASLFWGPMGPLMKWLGGIPIKMGISENVVQQTINAFNLSSNLVIVIAPEANRAYVQKWRTGFYHIAVGANVPIVLGFLDFSKKQGGYLKSYLPTGDLDSDLAIIKAQYQGINGKYADQSD
jgi:1-acyl-sn-glycerol-3-phosphate acyltransferase